MPRPIVAGLDGSPESRAAADWAAGEARRRGLPLKLLHAAEPGPYYGLLGSPEPRPEWADRVLREAAGTLREHYPDVSIEAEEHTGNPVNTLTSVGNEAELLALGSRGLSGLTGFLVGSVSLAVLAQVERPAVLVRTEAHQEMRREEEQRSAEDEGGTGTEAAPRREVVLGLKLGRPADALIDFAFRTAADRGAPLRAVHTWNFPPLYGYAAGTVDPQVLADLGTQEARALTEALEPWRRRFPEVEVVEDVDSGRPGPRLTEAAAGARLVVVGRRIRKSRVGAHIGPTVHAVLHHCPAPLAVVPHE